MEKKYSKAIAACNKRDSLELSWELIRVCLQDLDNGNPPELGKTVVIELVKTVSAAERQAGMPGSKVDQVAAEPPAKDMDRIKDWLKG
jgi:hypothetical protein